MIRKSFPVFCDCKAYILLCRCGCGGYVKVGNRFISGHINKNKQLGPRSMEVRERISAALKGRKKTPEHKANAAKAKVGGKRRPHTSEAKARIRAYQLASWKDPEIRAKRLTYPKHKQTPETRARMRASRAKVIPTFRDTKTVEIPLQNFFKDVGLEFKKQAVMLDIYPAWHPFDLVIPSLKLIVEGHGCYWHRCPIHAPDSPHVSFFDKELPEVKKHAEAKGWKLVEIWEHDIKSGAAWDDLSQLIELQKTQQVGA